MARTNRYFRFSKLSEAKFRQLIRCFALDLTATQTAHLTGVSLRSVNAIFLRLRRKIAAECERQSPFVWRMKVVTAASPDNKDTTEQGSLVESKELRGNITNLPVAGTLIVGDFNNDGFDEIAALSNNNHTIVFYSVDPATLEIKQSRTVDLVQDFVDGQVALAAGRFRNQSPSQTNADLVVFGQIANSSNGYSIIPIKITPTGSASDGGISVNIIRNNGKPIYQFGNFKGADGALALAASLVNFPQLVEQQLVLGIRTQNGSGYIEIGSFNEDARSIRLAIRNRTEVRPIPPNDLSAGYMGGQLRQYG